MRRLAVAALVLLALAGCSSGDDFPSIGAPTSTTAGGSSPGPGPATTVRPGTGNAFCDFLQTYNDRFNRFNAGLVDPQQLRTTMNEAVAAVKDAEATAPAEIRADVVTLRMAMESLVRALEAVNFEITKLQLDSVTALRAPNVLQAGDRMNAYTREHCL